MSTGELTADAEMEKLQSESFNYFLHRMNPVNGLMIDKTAADWPASIAATGLALAAYPVAVERGFMPRAADRTNVDHAAFFLEQPARPRTRRHRLPGLLLRTQSAAAYGERRDKKFFMLPFDMGLGG